MAAKEPSESCFVADEGDVFDVPHPIAAVGDVVDVDLETTRVVGTVDSNGFLAVGDLHLSQGTLAQPLVLTVRARLSAPDAAGSLRLDGLDVAVVLHRETTKPISLGTLDGSFGFGRGSGWQTFQLAVNVLDVKFPADPCPGQFGLCDQPLVKARNVVSFVFSGHIPFGLTFELDWLMLEPQPPQLGLAARPVLLVPGWNRIPADLVGGPDSLPMKAAWAEGLASRDLFFAAVALDPVGTIRDNVATFSAAVTNLKERYGVERVNVVGYCKGGINAREHAHRHPDDIDRLIMLATPNAGSFRVEDLPISPIFSIFTRVDGWHELSAFRMQKYNRNHLKNPGTEYISDGITTNSPAAAAALQLAGGGNDEFVSQKSVNSLDYAAKTAYAIDVTAPEAANCVGWGIGMHLCLLSYDDIVDQLTPDLAVLTPPRGQVPAPGGPAGLTRAVGEADPDPGQADVAAVIQCLRFDTAPTPAGGDSQTHTVLVDVVDTTQFLVFVDRAALQLQLISPVGGRIDPATPLTDPAVVHTPLQNAGPMSMIGYSVQAPEPGTWTVEVTGTGTPAPDTTYALTVLAQLSPGTGIILDAAVDQDQYVAGDRVTITARVTGDGEPLTDAIVTATVTNPDGTATTDLVLVDGGIGGDTAGGGGVYTGGVVAASSGFSSILVSAQSAAPAFTRQQQLEFLVVPNATRFSGSVSDHGVDLDGDGRFDQLVVEVQLDVAEAATYRLFGTLSDGAGTAIQRLQAEQQLAVGLQSVALAFDGGQLFDLGHDGPYLLEDLVLEDAATDTGLDVAAAYTTAVYAHTDFRRSPLALTGNTSDHGAHSLHMERLPYEELVIAVEVDTSTPVDVEATANLYAEDGSFIAAGRVLASLAAGLSPVEFHFTAHSIFRAGKPGPYTLQLLSLWGTAADGTAASLLTPGVVAVTQAYRLEDFAESPRFTVGGTVTGLVGFGLQLELVAEGPPGTLPVTPLRIFADGPFTFDFAELVSGNPYEVRVKTMPANPVQVCTVNNAGGTIEDADVTNVEVVCV